jgi:Holliday junction resolvase RusA-like endonuclease
MSRSLSLTVLGKPQQQGSKTAYVVKGRAVMTEANKNLMPWRKQAIAEIQAAIKEQGWEKPTTEGITLTVAFYFDRPKTVKRNEMTVKPDTDHLIRAVGDALTQAHAIPDDSQITTITASKHYGEARTEITLFY